MNHQIFLRIWTLCLFYHVFNSNFLTNKATKLRNISDCRQFLCGSVFFKCKNTGRFLFWSRAFPVAPFWSRLFGRNFLVASFWSLLLRKPSYGLSRLFNDEFQTFQRPRGFGPGQKTTVIVNVKVHVMVKKQILYTTQEIKTVSPSRGHILVKSQPILKNYMRFGSAKEFPTI